MDRVYNIQLDCGCMIAKDSGTPEEPNGDAGCSPCYAEYGDLNTTEGRKALAKHEKCWAEYRLENMKLKDDYNTQKVIENLKKSIMYIDDTRAFLPEGTRNRTLLRTTKKIMYNVLDDIQKKGV